MSARRGSRAVVTRSPSPPSAASSSHPSLGRRRRSPSSEADVDADDAEGDAEMVAAAELTMAGINTLYLLHVGVN